MVRVLFMQSQAALTSAGAVHCLLARHFDPRRVEAHAAVTCAAEPDLPDAYREFAAIPGVHLRPTYFGLSLFRRSKGDVLRDIRTRGIPTLRSLVGLITYVKRRRIDIIHASGQPQDIIFGLLLARLTGARFIVHAHMKFDAWMGKRRLGPMRMADGVIAISRYVKESAMQMGFAPGRLHTVHNAIDASRWDYRLDGSAVRRELCIPGSAPTLAIVARVVPKKGHEELFRALALVRGRHPGVRLLVVGGDDTSATPDGQQYSDVMKALARELDLGDTVIFTGARTDISSVLAACDIFAMPCYEEGFGLAFVEAMAMKRPVVAIKHGGTPEVVEDGMCGLLSTPGDADQLADNLLTLIEHPDLRRAMGEYGRQRAETYFHPRRMAEDVEGVYRHLLADA